RRMRTRCSAVIPTWCATCRKYWSSAACAGIDAASRGISRSRRIGNRAVIALARRACRRQRRPKSFGKRDLTVANGNELDVEDQRRIRRNDVAGSAAAVGQVRRNHERASAADAHAGDTVVPAGNDATAAQRETERRTAIERGVEFSPFFIG